MRGLETLLRASTLVSLGCVGFYGGCTKIEGGRDGDPQSGKAQLSELKSSEGELSPPFAATTLAYKTDVPLLVSSFALTPVAPAGSIITINGSVVVSGKPSNPIDLDLGDNAVTVQVRPDDETADTAKTQTYTVTVRRAATLSFVKASNPGESDIYGAAISVNEDILVVGAQNERSATMGIDPESNDGALNSGAAYVYQRTEKGWKQQAFLKASNTEAGDVFGERVSVDKDTIVVGAPLEDSASVDAMGNPTGDLVDSGAAYVFVRENGKWRQQAMLKASDAEESAFFGVGAAISGDTLAVAARVKDNGASVDVGAVYVFVRNAGKWTERKKLLPSNPDAYDFFGHSLAISGNTIVVGSLDDSAAAGVGADQSNNDAPISGAAYVFVGGGDTWTQQAYLKASNPSKDDRFGNVAISGDTIVVGAWKEDSSGSGVDGEQNDRATDSGAAYVFTRMGTTWREEAYLKPLNTGAGDQFGYAVSISGDVIVVGANFESGAASGVNGIISDGLSESGAAYVFVRRNSVWSQLAYLKATNPGAGDWFGTSVAISGRTIAVGAYREDSGTSGVDNTPNELALDSGAAYVFR